MKANNTGINYSTSTRNVQLLIDEVFAEKVIPAEDSVRLLDQIIEEMDLSALYRAYERHGRKPATTPSTMLKVVLYGNMEGRYSSRAIQSSCQRDINYIWLLNGEKAPSHFQIARFRSKYLAECGEELFYTLVKKLAAIGELRYEHLFVDGTKIEANANKYSFVWEKSTTKYEKRLTEKLSSRTAEYSAKYGIMADGADLLAQMKAKHSAPFVHGRGKRKSQLQRDIEELEAMLERKEKYAQYQRTFRGRKSFSKTDPDATFMHMKEDHMRNSQLKPGYNIQFGVEGEYITGVWVSSERNDQLALKPLLEDMHQHLEVYYCDMTADAGYESEENYSYFEDISTECYIKPTNYERSKTKKYKSNMALRENMLYDGERDEYTCQNGKKLTARYCGTRVSKSGFESEITYYECESCEGCAYKRSCTRAKGNRKLQVSKKFIEQRKASLARITSKQGILLRMNRSIQSEGAFGVVKQDRGFRQFLLRGSKKVKAEILLIAMAYNVNKYHAKLQQNRTGKQLFEKLSS